MTGLDPMTVNFQHGALTTTLQTPRLDNLSMDQHLSFNCQKLPLDGTKQSDAMTNI